LSKLDLALIAGRTGHGHDARAGYLLDRGEQEHRQGKRPEIVRRKLALESIAGHFTRWKRHYTRVVDQQVERLSGKSLKHPAGEGMDGSQLGEVENLGVKPCVRDMLENALNRVVGLGLRSGRQDQFGAFLGQCESRLKSDAAVRAGDQCPATELRGNVCRGPFGFHFRFHWSSIVLTVSDGNKAPKSAVLT
jgi:hypothetical protein